MKGPLVRAFHHDALSATLAFAVGACSIALVSLVAAIDGTDDANLSRFLLGFGLLNAGAVLTVLVTPISVGNVAAWVWAAAHCMLAFVSLLSIGIYLAPWAIVWVMIAVRRGLRARWALVVTSLVVGSAGWSFILVALF